MTFISFRLHVRACWSEVITQMHLVLPNIPEGDVVLDLIEDSTGLILGDCNYGLPKLKERLHRQGICLVTSFRYARHAPAHSWSRVLGRVRYWIDTVFGHLVER